MIRMAKVTEFTEGIVVKISPAMLKTLKGFWGSAITAGSEELGGRSGPGTILSDAVRAILAPGDYSATVGQAILDTYEAEKADNED
jgi:hypothetical protein